MNFDRLLAVSLLLACMFGCSQPPADAPADSASTPEPAQAATTDPSNEGATPEAYNNTIRWRTASEVDNFGFDVYRGDAENGPFTRLTESPIDGAGTTDEPTSYTFVDDTIAPDRAYWYYVESISMNNHREKFTPTYCAKPKVGPNLCEAAKAEGEDDETANADDASGH